MFNCFCSLIHKSAQFAISSANIRQNRSETSSVMKIPPAHCSRSKVHKSLINNVNSSGLLTSPCMVQICQRKAFIRSLTVRNDAYKLEYKDFTVLKNCHVLLFSLGF